MNTENKRVLTGLALACLLIYLIFWASVQALQIAALLLSWVCLWEFYCLFWPGARNLGYKALGLAAALPIVLHAALGWPLLGVLLVVFWLVNLVFLLVYSMRGSIDWVELQVISLGILYAPVVLQFLPGLRTEELLLVFVAALGTDTGAYYAGTHWGRSRIWTAVSPKKSWTGAWSGLLVCVLLVLLLGLFLGSSLWYHWLWLGVLLSLAAQFGDFFESGLKRQLQVKDSGWLLPGHGGFLDRLDSLLLVLPVYVLINSFWAFF